MHLAKTEPKKAKTHSGELFPMMLTAASSEKLRLKRDFANLMHYTYIVLPEVDGIPTAVLFY